MKKTWTFFPLRFFPSPSNLQKKFQPRCLITQHVLFFSQFVVLDLSIACLTILCDHFQQQVDYADRIVVCSSQSFGLKGVCTVNFGGFLLNIHARSLKKNIQFLMGSSCNLDYTDGQEKNRSDIQNKIVTPFVMEYKALKGSKTRHSRSFG